MIHKVKLNQSKLGNMFCTNLVTNMTFNNLVTAKYILLFETNKPIKTELKSYLY
jgi:hypothetical protein